MLDMVHGWQLLLVRRLYRWGSRIMSGLLALVCTLRFGCRAVRRCRWGRQLFFLLALRTDRPRRQRSGSGRSWVVRAKCVRMRLRALTMRWTVGRWRSKGWIDHGFTVDGAVKADIRRVFLGHSTLDATAQALFASKVFLMTRPTRNSVIKAIQATPPRSSRGGGSVGLVTIPGFITTPRRRGWRGTTRRARDCFVHRRGARREICPGMMLIWY